MRPPPASGETPLHPSLEGYALLVDMQRTLSGMDSFRYELPPGEPGGPESVMLRRRAG